ncbi:creatininase family protein [Halomontanus rarus]|uniref:creatininase family protein n=1 Tax=Halomontanus rarus TaxID=3034020 RepID=UPI0023E86CEA|nr:creatininase family protein [Halovivax sp. TS33]
MLGNLLTGFWSWLTKTAPEIRDIGAANGSVLIVPVGSVEQHGSHMPVGTDTILVSEVAALGAERVDDLPVLVAPPIWSGYSPHHLHFGGTLSLSFETALATLEDVVNTGLENGFDAVLLLNGHGGNTSLIGAAVSELGIDNTDVEVTGLTYFALAVSFVDEIRDSEPGGMAHGGEFETSLMLHLHEDLVGDDREAEPWNEPHEHGTNDLVDPGPLSVYRSFEEYSASGAIGEPDLASAEKGAEIFDRLGDELESVLRELSEQNRS